MGFDSFANIVEFKNYYRKENYGNDNNFDGYWCISDDNFTINYLYNNYQFTIGDYLIIFNGEKFTEAFNVINDPWLKTSLNIDSIPLKYHKTFKAVIQQFNQRGLDNKMTVE